MLLNLLRHTVRQTLQSLYRNTGLVLATTGIVVVSLLLLGSFLLVAVNMERLVQGLETTVEIGVFLEDGADREAVEAQLAQLEGVASFVFVPPDEGLQSMSAYVGDDLVSEMAGERNPLPEAFRVTATEAEIVPQLAAEILALPGVEKAEYGEEIVRWLLTASRWVNTVSLGGGLALAAAAVFLIITTIRLSLLARQEEVGIMKYLGASNWFIRFPFLLEGMTIGLVGTIVAVAALAAGYYHLAELLLELDLLFFWRPVMDPEVLYPIWLSLLALGTCLGGLGSLVSLHRSLKV